MHWQSASSRSRACRISIPDGETTPKSSPGRLENSMSCTADSWPPWIRNYLERIRRSSTRPPSMDQADMHTRVTRGLSSAAFVAFTQALARSKARLRAAVGLIVVRRWQVGHSGNTPQSLEAAAKEAGLPSVPVDPYDGQPIRFALVEGKPTVYSVGQDAVDDGGRIDNARMPDSGDVVLRLASP